MQPPDVDGEDDYMSACSSMGSHAGEDEDLYRACFEGAAERLRQILPNLSVEQLAERDRHGLTPLHICAFRGHDDCVTLLLDAGASLRVKSEAGWLAIDEAHAYGQQKTATLLLNRAATELKNKVEAKAKALRDVITGMPDCAFQLKWELTSILKVLLSKFLPHDAYTVYKKGSRMRIDGSLRGLKTDATSMLPQWKYGSFSLVIDTNNVKQGVLFVDHVKKTFMRVHNIEPEGDEDLNVADEEDNPFAQSGPVKYSRMKFANFKLQPVKGWFTAELTEDIEGMTTTVFEAEGELRSSTIIKRTMDLPATATYEDYLAHPPVEDIQAEVGLNLSNAFGDKTAADAQAEQMLAQERRDMAGTAGTAPLPDEADGMSQWLDETPSEFGSEVSHSTHRSKSSLFGRRKKRGASGVGQRPENGVDPGGGKAVKGRRVRARVWMARDFPLNQKQLLPLLDIMGATNKYLRKVSTFMRKYGDMELFPVKLQIPLVFSLRIGIKVKHLCLWDNGVASTARRSSKAVPPEMLNCPDETFFMVPSDYTERQFTDWIAKSQDKIRRSRPSSPRGAAGSSPAGRADEDFVGLGALDHAVI